jgi:glycosyltransferase involved in cell wall biosynthesis
MKVSIVIPVYNEARTVTELLNEVWNQPLSLEKELVIIESNSTDGSRELVLKFATEKNKVMPGSVNLLLQEKPRGKGFAMRAGYARATGDIILNQDADLEYDVKDYPALLAPIVEGKRAFVLGSRHMAANSWQIRRFEESPLKAVFFNFGGFLFHGFFNLLYGTHITDPTTMYKVFRRDCLEHFTLTCNRFDMDFELLGKLIRSGFIPLEIPISYQSRGYDEGKKVSILRDPPLWVRAIVKTRFAPLKQKTTSP